MVCLFVICLFVFLFSLIVEVLWGGVGWVVAFWGYSSSPNMVAAGPEPGGHQALLPCGGSQVTGMPIAASLWLPSPGELLSPGLYPHTPLSSGSCTQHTLTHIGFRGPVCSVECSVWGHVGGPLCCTLQFPAPVLITP